MGKELNYSQIKNYIELESDSECKLITTENEFLKLREGINNFSYKLPLEIQCKCGNIFNTNLDSFKYKNQTICKFCSEKNRIEKRSVSYEEIKEYVNGINGNDCCLITTTEDFILEKIKQNKSSYNLKIKLLCSCGEEFETTFCKFKTRNKRSCNHCSLIKQSILARKTHEQFIVEFNKLEDSNDYTVLNEYKKGDEKILFKHNIKTCGYEFLMTPESFMNNGSRCPKCNGGVKNKTTEYFKQQIFELVQDEYTVLEDYVPNKKILIRHNICGHEYNVEPSNFIFGTRCPKCNESKGEKSISKYLKERDIDYIPQKEFEGLVGLGNGKLSYDFYLPNFNLLIEYQGEQHEKFNPWFHRNIDDFYKQQEHDNRKKEYAINNKIDLLEIWYYDFDNIEEILKNNLESKVNT